MNTAATVVLLHAAFCLSGCAAAPGAGDAARRAGVPAASAPGKTESASAVPVSLGKAMLAAALASPPPGTKPKGAILLRPARVFDGTVAHEGWVALVRGER